METFKIGLFFLGFIFLLACGETPGAEQTATPDTQTFAKPTAVAVSANVATTTEESASANDQLHAAEEELKAEVMENESPDEEEMDYENVENPQPKKKLVVEPLKPSEKNVEIEESIAQNSKPATTPQKPEVVSVNQKVVAEPATPETETVVPAPTEIKKEVPVKPAFNHDAFNTLLTKHVSAAGKVNYKAFKADEAKLDAYLKTLENTPLDPNWSRAKQMAYYINAYNAATIKLILKNWPVKSITDLHGGKPWDVKWVKLGGKTLSLNAIENDILRPKYNDARIHFAVNCAAKSCPPLLNKAWTESNLNKYLDQQATAFINNPNFNALSAGNVEISKIFDWYAADFGDITDYLNKYAKTNINDNAKVAYKEYNWALNN